MSRVTAAGASARSTCAPAAPMRCTRSTPTARFCSPASSDRATARYDGGTGQIFGEVGYGFAFGKSRSSRSPAARGFGSRHRCGSRTRQTAALNIAANSFEVGYSTLGIRAASRIPIADDMVLVPRASAAWQHAFDDVTPAAAARVPERAGGAVRDRRRSDRARQPARRSRPRSRHRPQRDARRVLRRADRRQRPATTPPRASSPGDFDLPCSDLPLVAATHDVRSVSWPYIACGSSNPS